MKQGNTINQLFIKTIAVTAVISIAGTLIISNHIGGKLKEATTELQTKASFGKQIYNSEEAGEEVTINEEPVRITISEIQSQIDRIGTVITSEYTYSGSATSNASKRSFWGLGPEHHNSMTVYYEGTIYAGYNIDSITIELDKTDDIIWVTLPQTAQIIDNSIAYVDSEYYDDRVCPLDPDTSTSLLNSSKTNELAQAVNAGILDTAEEHAQEIITETLSVFEGYEVRFVDN